MRDFKGVKFFFSGDGIDMNTRSGRFVADINVAMAKHYIDNLREEVIKGIYGRLKQGIYPFKAPLGYLDMGGGKVKEFDPVTAPIIKEAFRLCGEEKYSMSRLGEYFTSHGITTSTGKPLSKGAIARILHNPFYIGVMKVKGQTYIGKHQKLITSALFHKVQDVLSGKNTLQKVKHDYLYRRTITCNCGRILIGEKQKGRVYYRCQNKNCPETTMREDRVTSAIENYLSQNQFSNRFLKKIHAQVLQRIKSLRDTQTHTSSSLKLQLSNTEARLDKLTDLLLDGFVDDKEYMIKKEKLTMNIVDIQERIDTQTYDVADIEERVKKILELSQNLIFVYKNADKEKRRILLQKTFSNFSLVDGELVLSTRKPISFLLNTTSVSVGGHNQNNTRKLSSQEQVNTIANKLVDYYTKNY